MSRYCFALAVVAVSISAAVAQNAPSPQPPFPAPISGFQGRFLDSTQVQDFQFPNRTLRAMSTKSAPELDRLFMILGGGTLAAFRLSTFTSRLSEPLATSAHGEKYLEPEMRVDPERPGSGWTTFLADGQQRLIDFDWDDRGNIYIAASIWGWAIVDLNGRLVRQGLDNAYRSILTFKSGGRYYALLCDGAPRSDLYDVTAPTNPVRLASVSFGCERGAKSNNGNTIAFVTVDGKLRIADVATLAAGGSGIQIPPPTGGSWVDVTSDGLSFYALANGPLFTVTRISGDATAPTVSVIDTNSGFGTGIGYGAGYLVVHAIAVVGLPTVVLYRVASAPAVKTDVSSFFRSSYSSHFVTLAASAPVVYARSEKTLLVGPYYALGDVYELTPALPPADVLVSQTAPATAPRGGSIAYALTITNSGPANASGIVVSDTFPPNSIFRSVDAPSFACSTASGQLICTAPSLSTGATAVIHVTVAASNSLGTIQNSITASADNPDPNTANNTATASTAVVSPANLSATKAVSTTPLIGNPVTYAITITNSGPDTQLDNPGDEFTDTLPSNLTLNGATATSGTTAINAATRTVTWNGSLAAGASTTITVSATLATGAVGTTVSNQAVAHFDQDGNGTNEATTTTNLASFQIARAVDVSSTMTVSDPTRIHRVGDTVTYTIGLTNAGPRAQNDNPGDEFVDTLPTSLSVLSATASSGVATNDPSTVHWNGSIPAGGTVSITIVARIQAAPPSTTIVNQGMVLFDANGDGINDTTAIAQATFAFDVAAIPTLSAPLLALMALAFAAIALFFLRAGR
jgi:uncharacterized repeat protein (TIGR01451 family)